MDRTIMNAKEAETASLAFMMVLSAMMVVPPY